MSSILAVEAAERLRHRRAPPVAVALGRVEGRKLLRHPISIVGALGSLAIPVVLTWNEVPVLNQLDSHTNEALIPFAAAILVAAQLGTMRARRNQTTELFTSAPAGEGPIVTGHLLAVLQAARAALVLVMVQLTYMKLVGGVTMPRVHVVLIGPALVAFGGAVGVAVGRWAPRLFAAPVAIAGLVAVCTAITTNSWVHEREWLSLWVISERMNGVTSEITLRPYGWRLAYFVALVFIASGIAIAHLPNRRIVAGGLIAAAIAVAGIAGARQMEVVPRAEQRAMALAFMERFDNPSCTERGSVEYCPMEGYAHWTALWQPAVEGVLAVVPVEARPTDLRLLQAPSNAEIYDERVNFPLARRLQRAAERGTQGMETDIRPSLSWGRNSKRGPSELALALEVASRVTGIDTRFYLTKADIAEMPKRFRKEFQPTAYWSCTTLEQGRAIVALWLAAQSTESARGAFAQAIEANPFVVQPADRTSQFMDPQQWALGTYIWDTLGTQAISWGTRESAYAQALLERDPGEVKDALADHWERLVDPETTADEAATLLGLQTIPSLEQVMKNWGMRGHYAGVEYFGVLSCR